MSNESDIQASAEDSQKVKEHALYVEERKALIEAARDSAKTFDQAVLAFGSAIFAASVAFLKDVAPHPLPYTLKWLELSWVLFSVGLLGALLSFLFSHRACMFEVEIGGETLFKPDYKRPKNRWSNLTDICNYSCIALLFVGLITWSLFAVENLSTNTGDASLNNQIKPPNQVDRGYVPPPPPRTPPPPQTPPPAPLKK
jgi:hypothetical protein